MHLGSALSIRHFADRFRIPLQMLINLQLLSQKAIINSLGRADSQTDRISNWNHDSNQFSGLSVCDCVETRTWRRQIREVI